MSEKKERKPPLTIEIMDSILKAENISVRFNLITKETEINGVPDILNPDDLLNDLPIWIHDRCKGSFTCNKDQISDLIKVLAGQYRYNPVDELLQGVRWDGADRIAELFEIMGITHDDLNTIHGEEIRWTRFTTNVVV